MVARKASDAHIAEAMRYYRSPAKAAASLDMTVRAFYQRLRAIEHKEGIKFAVEAPQHKYKRETELIQTERLDITVSDAVAVCYSDHHVWPGVRSTAYSALLALLPDIKPDYVFDLGDSLDGASISRHPPQGWQHGAPTMADELTALQAVKAEIREKSLGARHYTLRSNHGDRFDKYLATHAAELKGIGGTRLQDHSPDDKIVLTATINEHTLLIHAIRSGIHAQYNNVQAAHISVISGHLHSQKVSPRSTLSPVNGGTIYGVDVGMLGATTGPQFSYRLGTPSDWRSGFAVITFADGLLMPPELCTVINEDAGLVFFRGKLIQI